MNPPTSKEELMEDSVKNVLWALDLPGDAADWVRLPVVREAAAHDVDAHLMWARMNGDSLDNCELSHENLFRVLCQFKR